MHPVHRVYVFFSLLILVAGIFVAQRLVLPSGSPPRPPRNALALAQAQAHTSSEVARLRAELQALNRRAQQVRQEAPSADRQHRLGALRQERQRLIGLLREAARHARGSGQGQGPAADRPPRATHQADRPFMAVKRDTSAPAATDQPAVPLPVAVPTQPRLAVLAADASAQPMALLTEAVAGNDGRWDLVDRARLTEAVSEQRLKLALGADNAQDRREVFQIVPADVILMVASDQQARVIHAATGLETAAFTSDGSADPQATATRWMNDFANHLSQPERRLRVVALPPVVDGRLVPAADGLAERLESRLHESMRGLGVALLAFDLAQDLDRERQFRGDQALSPIGRPWFVRAHITADPTTPDQISVSVALQSGDQTLLSDEWTTAFDTQALAFMKRARAAVQEGSSHATAAQGPDLDALAAQVVSLGSAGQAHEAIRVAETLLLHRPADTALRTDVVTLLSGLILAALDEKSDPPTQAHRVAGLFRALCRHFDLFLAYTTPSSSFETPNWTGEQLGAGYFRPVFSVLHRMKLLRWRDHPTDPVSGLPEALAQMVGDPYHDLLRRHARRLLRATRQGLSARGLSALAKPLDANSDIQDDAELMDLRVELWSQWVGWVYPARRNAPKVSQLPPAPYTAPLRRSVIAALDRAAAAGRFDHRPLDLERARALQARNVVSAADRFSPELPTATPHAMGLVDSPAAAQPPPTPASKPPASRPPTPTLEMHRIDLPAPPPTSQKSRPTRRWAGLTGCGPHGDLAYDKQELFLIRPDRSNQRLLRLEAAPQPDTPNTDRLAEPLYDGRDLWVPVQGHRTRLLRVDPETGRQHRLSLEPPLPPSTGGLAVAALGAGDLVVTGAFDPGGGLRSWSLRLRIDSPRRETARAQTLFTSNSSSISEDQAAPTANRVGRARVIRSSDATQEPWVLVEYWGGRLLILKPETGESQLADRRVGSNFDRLLITPNAVLHQFNLTQREVRLQVGDDEPQPFRTNQKKARLVNPVWHDGWEMRVGSTRADPHARLHLSRDLGTYPVAVAKLVDIQDPTRIIRESPDTTVFASRHHGLLLSEYLWGTDTLYAIPLPDRIDRFFIRTAPGQLGDAQHHDGIRLRPLHNAATHTFTFAQAREVAARIGWRAPQGPQELQAMREALGTSHPPLWVEHATHRMGPLTQADLLPGPEGPYGVALVKGQLVGLEPNAVAQMYVNAIWEDRRRPSSSSKPPASPHLAPPAVRVTVPSSSDPQNPSPPTEIMVAVTELTRLQYLRVTDPKRVDKLSPRRRLQAAWMPQELSVRETVRFCRQLNQLTGHQWRVPTEAEWEAAAGPDPPPHTDPLPGWCSLAGHPGAAGGPQRIGTAAPNANGLYDTWGNLAELTASAYNHRTGATQPWVPNDTHDGLITRGGAWFDDPSRCGRNGRRPSSQAGLRLVRNVTPDDQ